MIMKNEDEKTINKVILFTRKERVAPIFKALTCHMRERLRFLVIPVPEENAPQWAKDLAEVYQVESFPTMYVHQTYDVV